MDQISGTELIDAYAVFRALNKLPSNANSRRLFNRFLGRPEGALLFWSTEVDDATTAKVRWLLGPHAATMYKVWKLQHEGS